MTSLFAMFPLPWRAQVLDSGDRVAVIARNGRRVTEISPGQFHGHDANRGMCESLATVIVTAVNEESRSYNHADYSPAVEKAAIIEAHDARRATEALERATLMVRQARMAQTKCCGDAKPGDNTYHPSFTTTEQAIAAEFGPDALLARAREISNRAAHICGELEDGA